MNIHKAVAGVFILRKITHKDTNVGIKFTETSNSLNVMLLCNLVLFETCKFRCETL